MLTQTTKRSTPSSLSDAWVKQAISPTPSSFSTLHRSSLEKSCTSMAGKVLAAEMRHQMKPVT